MNTINEAHNEVKERLVKALDDAKHRMLLLDLLSKHPGSYEALIAFAEECEPVYNGNREVFEFALDELAPDKSEKERDFALRESQGVLTHEENEFREICADFLGCYWSTEEAGLEIPHNFWPHMKYTDRARRQHVTDAIDWLIDNSLVPPDAFKKARSSRCHQEERRCFTSSFGEKLFGMPFDQGRSRGDRKRCRRCVPRRRNIEDRLISV